MYLFNDYITVFYAVACRYTEKRMWWFAYTFTINLILHWNTFLHTNIEILYFSK